MGLDRIKKRGEDLGKKNASSFLRINMYENPQMALDLIAHICTSASDITTDSCSKEYEELVIQLKERLEGYTLCDEYFLQNCYSIGKEVCQLLKSNVTCNIKIAVAGGYSAGKSSLLNALTGIGNMLPTGIDPVSMVNTYINCSSGNKRLIVRGENLNDNLVLLNEDVLSCVQHSSRSKVYVSSVLKRILLDVPVPDELDKITFIDTPGYNNSDCVTEGSHVTDSEKAMEAISIANAIFWCIDSEAGTIPSSDVAFLKEAIGRLGDVPVVIVFTKMDKKLPEIAKILALASDIGKGILGENLVDVVGLSCLENDISFRSFSGFANLSQIISEVKKRIGSINYLNMAQTALTEYFEAELNSCQTAISAYEENRHKSIEGKKEWQSIYDSSKQLYDNTEARLGEYLLNSYDDVMKAADKRIDAFSKALEGWRAALNRECEWSVKSGFFADTESLARRYSDAVDSYNRLIQKDLSYEYWTRESREEICKSIREAFNDNLAELKKYREQWESTYEESVQSKKKERELVDILCTFKPQLAVALQACYQSCKQLIIKHNASLQQLKDDEDNDIFSAIYADNWKRFLSCCSHGVDLTICNAEGYSPITLACRQGNNEMVKFFVESGADMTRCDDRGYNALETAVLHHYKDICEILIAHDKSIILSCKPLADISKKNTFTEWISKL